MSAGKLLLVEDEPNVGSTLEERLRHEGFEVAWAKGFAEALGFVKSSGAAPFELALLDVGLGDGSGFDLASEIRARSAATAVVFVTALGRPEERVQGLELGAEDYIVKPFHFRELLLRVQNALKRARGIARGSGAPGASSVEIGRARVDFAAFSARRGAEAISLTHKECALLRLLHERRGCVVSREEILSEIWSSDELPTTRTVDNFILRLRKLVETDPSDPLVIRSIRGIGYQLVTEREKS
ncbi:MAG: response regulator transcription factor [Bdellovibrionales bacterium]|nr:response regulator transcription factor [Bdellovibrionales bacterium]